MLRKALGVEHAVLLRVANVRLSRTTKTVRDTDLDDL